MTRQTERVHVLATRRESPIRCATNRTLNATAFVRTSDLKALMGDPPIVIPGVRGSENRGQATTLWVAEDLRVRDEYLERIARPAGCWRVF